MAVYTLVTNDTFAPLAQSLGLTLSGELEPVSDGIENTTYFFSARNSQQKQRQYVLTVLENITPGQLHYSVGLTRHLCNTGLPVPCPREDLCGQSIHTLAGKPALVFPRIAGQHPEAVSISHCQDIGSFLARAHLAAGSYEQFNANRRGTVWLHNAREALVSHLCTGDFALLREQSERFRRLNDSEPKLPNGPIHGDLFRDNALFREDTLVGVIDYYNACNDWLLLDVAIAVNDWCCPDSESALDDELCDTLLHSYHSVRPFTTTERQYWQDLLCFAATRFWVSRLLNQLLPVESAQKVPTKNPEEYRLKLVKRMVAFPPLPR